MKKLVSVALLVTFVISTCIPSFAQKAKIDELDPVKPVRTRFGKVEALTDGRGVLIRWEMTAEKQNIGFVVDRLGALGNEQVNPAMVLGSSARGRGEITFGNAYQLFDPAGELGMSYVVRSLDQDGRQLQSRIIGTRLVKDIGAATGHTSSEWSAAVNSSNKSVAGAKMDLHPELAEAVAESTQAPDLTTHRWVVSQPGVKIGVRKEGLFRVTSAELQAAGFVGGDSAKWRLFAEGVEQAILVGPGGQYIEFYGKPIDTVESDTRVYYLTTGTVDGKRMATKVIRPIGGTSISGTYPVTTIKKERTSYVNIIQNGDAENYWGRVITSTPSTLAFSLTGVNLTGNIVLTLKMQGYSSNTHLLRLVLNGVEMPSMTWIGYTAFTGTLTLPASRLVEGNNALEITGMNQGDFSLFDSISVKYLRRYQADQNQVSFFTPGYRRIDLTGFSSPNIRVFDTTRDGDPTLILGLPVVQEGATFTAKLPSSRNMVAYGVEDSALLQAASITRNNPSSYTSSTDSSDLIIISHSAPDFMAAAETWANYRRNQGFTAVVIDVADIFDEFSYGSLRADAIRGFLNYAYTSWRVAPGYVMLMGDATRDPRNYEGFGYWDLVPTKNVSLIYEESSSDDALADFNGDGLSEISIGRIPARNAAAIATMFNKTVTFETAPNQSLDRGAIFAFDLPNGFDFAGMSLQLRNELPSTMTAVMVDRAVPTAQATLIAEMNTGRYVTNYSGHGSTGLWAASSFFGNTSVPDLTNASRPTIFTMLTCLNGYFVIPSSTDSLAETLLKASNGGAAVSWASTSLTTPDIQLMMGLRFYGQLGEGTIKRMGDLANDAKTAIPAGGDVRFSWVLLGDPMLKVR